jgi:YD repeat-containing protein
MPLEWDGDGRMDLLVDWSDGAWRVLRGTATGLAAPVQAGAGGVSSGLTSSWTVADLDGDGRDDLLRASSTPRRFYSRLNSGTGFTSEGIYNLAFLFAPAPVAFPASTYGTTDSRRADFDNDGREDFAAQGCEWDTERNKCITKRGGGCSCPMARDCKPRGCSIPRRVAAPPAFGDFNADHLTDVVYVRADGAICLALSRGRTGFTQVGRSVRRGLRRDRSARCGLRRRWIRRSAARQQSIIGRVLVARFPRHGCGLSSVPVPTSVPGLNSVVADVNGDGLADLARAATNGAWSWYPRLGVPGDLLAKVTDGFGVSAEWTRAPMSLASVYKRGTGAVYPMSDVGGSRPLVSRLRQADGSGTGAAFDLIYSYETARVHHQGRGWLGFATRTTSDDRLNYDLELKETYSQAFPYVGLIASRVLKRQNGSVLSDVVNTWSSVASGTPLVNERRLPYLAGSVARDYSSTGVLFRTTTSSIASVDATSGVALEQTTVVTENATGVAPGSSRTSRVVHTGLLNDTVNWCPGTPTTTQTTTGHTATGGRPVTRTFAQSWDGPMCRVTQQQLQPGDAKLQVTLAYTYDAFGNVASEKITGVGMPGRTTSIGWGLAGQFPETTTNALSQTATMSWDAELGVPVTARDPNLLTTSWEYDGFGRLTREQRPDQTSTTWTRSACAGCDTRSEYQVTETAVSATGAPFWSATREIDHHERVWKAAVEMAGGGDSVTSVDFDARGRVSSQRLAGRAWWPPAGSLALHVRRVGSAAFGGAAPTGR